MTNVKQNFNTMYENIKLALKTHIIYIVKN